MSLLRHVCTNILSRVELSQVWTLCSRRRTRWVLIWRLNEASDSSGDRRAIGSRFQVLEPYAAKQRWAVDVRVQGTRRAPETAERDWLHSALVQCWNGWIITMLHSSPFYNISGNVSHTLLGSDALQASPPTPLARWTRLVSAPAVV